jgi:hypothetical protein
MPSLLGTYVTANYGRMTAQQTYAVGEPFTNFGTRQLQIIKVLVSGSNTDFTTANGQTGSYADSNSLFSAAIRALQQFGEVYAVYTPVATGFIAVVAFDTANTADSGNGPSAKTQNLAPDFTANGLIEGSIKAAVDSIASTTSTITVTAPTIAIGTTL